MTTSMQSHKNLFLFDEVHFVGVVERRFDSQCVCAILYIFFVCFGACADSFYIASNKKYITCCDIANAVLDVVKKILKIRYNVTPKATLPSGDPRAIFPFDHGRFPVATGLG
eukprot:1116755_1